LIVHPGLPGDAGPSSLHWLLFGNDGSIEDFDELLERVGKGKHFGGRSVGLSLCYEPMRNLTLDLCGRLNDSLSTRWANRA
jgi:hypothetical protein